MGSRTGYDCESCGTSFAVDSGGGFMFDQLDCDTCGKVWSIGHRDMGDLHLGFIKGLDRPYAIARAAGDARIQREWPGPVVSREDDYAGVEAMAPVCECGGRVPRRPHNRDVLRADRPAKPGPAARCTCTTTEVARTALDPPRCRPRSTFRAALAFG